MKTWMWIVLAVFGFAALLALSLCKASAQADRMSRKFNPPPHDYEK